MHRDSGGVPASVLRCTWHGDAGCAVASGAEPLWPCCRVDDAQYSAPLALRALVVAACAVGGAAIAWVLDAGLGVPLRFNSALIFGMGVRAGLQI